MSVAEPPLITRTEPVPSWIVPVKVVAFDPSSRSVPAVVEVFVTTPADPAKAATVTISRAWSSQPIKVTGLPVRQAIPLNNAEMKLTVEASELRGYGTATLSLCGRG